MTARQRYLTISGYQELIVLKCLEMGQNLLDVIEGLLRLYTMLTIFALFGDIVQIVIQAWRFDRARDEFAEIGLLMLTICFSFADLFFIGWIAYLQLRLPREIGQQIFLLYLAYPKVYLRN